MNKIEGLIAAAFTPFYEDGSINRDMIPLLVNKLVRDGLKGIFVCGSNGEGPNMTIAERKFVAEEFVKAAAGRLKIIVHVGHSSITEARALAVHAAEIKADAFASVAAFYFKPTNVQNLVNCMGDIAGAAPDLPFYYYHIPHLTGVGMDMVKFLELAEGTIPNLAGIKYTASTLQEYQSCLNYGQGRYDILYGVDELLLPALAAGAKAAIGSTYTFAAPLYLRTMDAFQKGDMETAREQHAYLVEVIRILLKYPPIPGQKAMMQMLGWDMGPCRLPLATLDRESFDEFYRELDALSFFDRVGSRKVKYPA